MRRPGQRFLRASGTTVTLRRELGVGGEGAVFEIAEHPGYVAKIYHERLNPQKEQKLRAMPRLADPSVLKVAAWPVDTLHERQSGPILGIVLPRIDDASEVHELYSPAHRRSRFPDADWRHLIQAARNIAAGFATLHARNVVLGDVNQGNLFVDKRMVVRLIDCDSFQFAKDGQVYRCEVGVPHFTPPELQGVNFRQINRTCGHDGFGLAVLIFHLLFMGRHPFAGRYLRHGEDSIERAISEHRFAFSKHAEQRWMAPPPHSLPLTSLPESLAKLFERAFDGGSVKNGHRPSAIEWARELESLQRNLAQCQIDPAHYHFRQLRSCPWCELVRSGGPNFFISVTLRLATSGKPAFDVQSIWVQIQAVGFPSLDYRRLAPPPAGLFRGAPLPEEYRDNEPVATLVKWIAVVSAGVCLPALLFPPLLVASIAMSLIFGVWRIVSILNRPIWRLSRDRAAKLHQLQRTLSQVEYHWNAELQKTASQFDVQARSLTAARQRYASVAQDRAAELQALQQNAAHRQLENYLRQRFVNQAKIKGIGAGRLATLEYYGIETAFDVTRDRVRAVPGFGDSLTASVVEWRKHVEASFRFNPSQGLPPADVQNLEIKFFQLRRQLELQFVTGLEHLKQLRDAAKRQVIACGNSYSHSVVELHQAKADLDVCLAARKSGGEVWWIAVACLVLPLLLGITRLAFAGSDDPPPVVARIVTAEIAADKPSIDVPPPQAIASAPSETPRVYRTWLDATGSNSIEAALLERYEHFVVLLRRDHVRLTFPIDKLSASDQLHLEAWPR